MKSWQSILREEMYNNDFELVKDNDKYIVDGVIKSYKTKITAHYEQVKEILDGAFEAGFKLDKRRYATKTAYVLTKSFKNAYLVFQFSLQPNTLLVCEVAYGGVDPTAKKSKYFPTVFKAFDKTLPLYFMNTDIDKETLTEEYHININDEYNWSEYFDYVYSFMIYMLEQLNDESDVYLEESLTESIEEEQENNVFDLFTDKLHAFDNTIQTEISNNKAKKEVMFYLKWDNDYRNQPDDVKESLNTIINDFIESFDKSTTEIEMSRARTNLHLARTIFIKYL